MKKGGNRFYRPQRQIYSFFNYYIVWYMYRYIYILFIVFLEDQKVRSTEINYFKGMYWYPTDLYKVFTRWNLNFLCYGDQWSFAKHNTPLLGIQRGRCKFWPTEKPVLSLLGLYYVRFLSDLYKPLNPVFRLAIGDPVKAEKCSNCFRRTYDMYLSF